MSSFFPFVIAQTPAADAPSQSSEGLESGEKSGPAASPELLKIGQQQYVICAACHGQQGEGLATGPPLAGSEWVNGPVENLIKIQLRGLTGPIEVRGQQYNMPGGMAPLAYQSDQQIAGVLSYIRKNFGNDSSGVTPEQVAALRGEVGKGQITAEELEQPEVSNGPPLSETGEPLPVPEKYKDLEAGSSINPLVYLAALIVIIVVVVIFRRKGD